MTTQWRKSSYSGGISDQQCVELGRVASGIGVRDSKDPEAGHLTLTSTQFVELIEQIRRER